MLVPSRRKRPELAVGQVHIGPPRGAALGRTRPGRGPDQYGARLTAGGSRRRRRCRWLATDPWTRPDHDPAYFIQVRHFTGTGTRDSAKNSTDLSPESRPARSHDSAIPFVNVRRAEYGVARKCTPGPPGRSQRSHFDPPWNVSGRIRSPTADKATEIVSRGRHRDVDRGRQPAPRPLPQRHRHQGLHPRHPLTRPGTASTGDLSRTPAGTGACYRDAPTRTKFPQKNPSTISSRGITMTAGGQGGSY